MIKRQFIVTRTELQLHNGMVEVSAISPDYLKEQDPGKVPMPETMFLYLDPTKDTVPMVGETLTAEVTGIDD